MIFNTWYDTVGSGKVCNPKIFPSGVREMSGAVSNTLTYQAKEYGKEWMTLGTHLGL